MQEWLAGARPRTLPAALSPVLTGLAVAGDASPQRLAFVGSLALFVSLMLQIGVNYANDYSDGIRGTDDERVGPARLVAGGLAAPTHVKLVAFGCFGLAAIAGLVLIAWTGHWWLIAVGVASIAAAWYYTGGSHPYGYVGLGEVSVFIFFGLVAVGGTAYLVSGLLVSWAAAAGAIAMGCYASALLLVNNLRDINTDIESGKRTLATRIGARATQALFTTLLALALLSTVVVAALTSWWALLGLVAAYWVVRALARVWQRNVSAPGLIEALGSTAFAQLVAAVGMSFGVLVMASGT